MSTSQRKKSLAIGIDLGTTNSCVAVWRKERVEVIANDLGSRITPSCVAFCDSERLIGSPAFLQRTKNPKNAVYDVKRLMGRRFNDPEVQEDMKRWPFTVVDVGGKPRIQVEYKKETKMFAPEQISAMILRKMKYMADKYLDCDVKDAVITVPAYFNNAQRQATIDAGKIAGLNVLRIINEPTAAALAYGLGSPCKNKKNVLIYDLGGGTFDVSIVSVEKGPKINVLSTAGNTHLGGTDFDNLLVKYLVDTFKRKEGIDVSKNIKALSKLKKASEKAKQLLSSRIETELIVDALIDGIDFYPSLSRAKLEEQCSGLFRSTLVYVTKALDDAKLKKDNIDDVVLVGGSTRIPRIKQLLQDFFPGKSLKETINPDEAVAYGAAVQAALLSENRIMEFQDLSSLDITPLSLGIENPHGDMEIVVPRNTAIPCKVSQRVFTVLDNQPGMTFKVFEGDEVIARGNHFLGEFLLNGIPAAPARKGEARVTYDLNENGVLKVTAVEKVTRKSKSIVISMNESGLSESEIVDMIEDEKMSQVADRMEMARLNARNRLEICLFNLKLAVGSSRLTDDKKKHAAKLCNEIFLWLEDNDLASEEEYVCKEQYLNQLSKELKIKLTKCRVK